MKAQISSSVKNGFLKIAARLVGKSVRVASATTMPKSLPAQVPRACEAIDTQDVSYLITYRDLVSILPVSEGEFPTYGFDAQMFFGCASIEATLYAAIDIRYDQQWNFQSLHLSDVATLISLAPKETLTVRIKHTQKRRLESATAQSSDSEESADTSEVHKDVMNVVTSAAHTENWKVDGNGNFSVGPFSFGASAGGSGGSSSDIRRTSDHITESTRRSASRLKLLKSISVTQGIEISDEQETTRRIQNPYPDRSLTLRVFEAMKSYQVRTAPVEIVPVLILEIRDIKFDGDFVLCNVDFLRQWMLDSSLLQELVGSLEAASSSTEVPSNVVLFLAKKALNILFGGIGDENIFSLGAMFDNIAQGFVAGLNQDGLSESSGLSDSINNNFGRSFEALTWYYHLWKQLVTQGTLEEHAIYLATSLAEFIQNEYSKLDTHQIINMTDTGQYTEPFRRVAGFLAMVQSLVPQSPPSSAPPAATQPQPSATEPIVGPEISDGAAVVSSRASFVINRVVNHLKSYKSYYLVNFLAYVDRRTNGLTRQETSRWAIRNIPPVRTSIPSEWLPLLDPSGALLDFRASFIDGLQLIIPSGMSFPVSSSAAEAGALQSAANISIPADGVHIESVAGSCPPLDPPPSGSTVTANINVTANE
jgi:hypothetical protein